jgi:hypothetical protein
MEPYIELKPHPLILTHHLTKYDYLGMTIPNKAATNLDRTFENQV